LGNNEILSKDILQGIGPILFGKIVFYEKNTNVRVSDNSFFISKSGPGKMQHISFSLLPRKCNTSPLTVLTM
jgi:hypothetical protein